MQGADSGGRRPHDDLYILIMDLPSAGRVHPAYPRLIEVISQTFYGMTGSVTRALRAAVLAANELLFEANLRADGEHLTLLGLNCAAVRQSDIYVAHLGPALTLVRQGDSLVRYPDDSIWFAKEPPDTLDMGLEPPAGLRRDLEPDLFHVALGEGDLLLMANTGLAQAADAATLAGALASADAGGALAAIESLGIGDMDAIAIEGLPQLVIMDAVADDSWPQRILRSPRQSRDPALTRALQPTDAPASSGPAPRLSPVERPVEARGRVPGTAEPDPAVPGTAAAPAPIGEPPPFLWPRDAAGATGRLPEAPSRMPIGGVVSDAADSPYSDAGDEADAYDEDEYGDEYDGGYDEDDDRAITAGTTGHIMERVRQSVPTLHADLAGLGHTVQRRAGRIRIETEDYLIRVLPDRLPERPVMHEESEQTISLPGRALIAVAFVIPLVMLFLVVMTRVQYDRARSQQFDSLQALAQARFDAAMQIESVVHQREALHEALASVEEGLAISPVDETLNTLRRRALHRLDEVDGVERLYHFWKLTEVDDDIISPTDSSRIVIHDNAVYILNRGSDRVYRFLLNEVGDALQTVDSNPVLAEKGSSVRGVPVGDLVDITWMEAGGARTLSTFVALERSGTLLAYDQQQGLDPLPVADSDIWLKPQAIGGYYGNFYVLDPLLGRILRYEPVDNIYTSPPSDYLDRQLDIDLTGAVDMTIDGNIYVLFADGRIMKFFKGERVPFNTVGLPSPMRSPTTITVSGKQEPDAYGHVYVTDAGNERIIEFDKEGNYVRQFRARPDENHFKNLRAVYVDEERGRMFVLSGKTLWLTNISSLVDR